MGHYRYLIVGGGMAGAAAVRGIRDIDPEGPIAVVGAELDRPYDRPPLSKALWKGEAIDGIYADVDRPGVVLQLGRRIQSVDPNGHSAVDDRGTTDTFEKCLLATGGTPRRLPYGGDRVIYFRTLEDYRRLRGLADRLDRFLVIGGGFIGSEIAAALAMNGKQVTLVISGAGIGARLYPPDLVRFLDDYYREKGVTVLVDARVSDIADRTGAGALAATIEDKSGTRAIEVDGVVAGIGVEPNVALARSAGLAIDDGIVVDEHLRTSFPDVYAAGDAANFYNPTLGRRMRVEHVDNAVVMGEHAGRSMAGSADPYTHQPMFYSDLFDLGYEAVGELDARHEIVADWREPFREGVVYYLANGRVRGVLLWNVWEQVDNARRLIAEPGPFRPDDLKGRLPA